MALRVLPKIILKNLIVPGSQGSYRHRIHCYVFHSHDNLCSTGCERCFNTSLYYAYAELIHVNSGEIISWTWEHIETNDIPKIYLAASDYEGALTYAERLGNTKVYDLKGDHVIFLDRTEDCADKIEEFLASLDT